MGTLPLSYLNVIGLQLLLEKGNLATIFFILGIVFVEFFALKITAFSAKLLVAYDKGASVIVVTSEKSEFIKSTIEKTGAEFTIIYDKDYKITKALDVLFLPNKMMRVMYNTVLGAKLKESHSDDTEQLPIPATFIISKEMKVKWRHFDPDYKKRSKMEDILANLN